MYDAFGYPRGDVGGMDRDVVAGSHGDEIAPAERCVTSKQ